MTAAAVRASNYLIWRRFRRNRLGLLGAAILLVLAAISVAAPWIAPREPNQTSILNRFTPPGEKGYVLGADELGRDLASRVLYAGRVSLGVGLMSGVVVVLIGGAIGLIAGYSGGRVDMFLMRVADVVLAFPTIFLLLAISALLQGASPPAMALIIGLTAWMDAARLVRSEVLSLKERDFIASAVAIGASTPQVLVRHLLPNIIGILVVAGTLEVARAILLESALSYFGFGIQPPEASWGNMLTNAQATLSRAPWLALIPGFMISLAVISVNFVGDAARDAIDPRTRI